MSKKIRMKYFNVFLTLFLFTSCQSQNAISKTDQMNIPIVTQETEKFNFAGFVKDESKAILIGPDGTVTTYMKYALGFSVKIQSPKSYFYVAKNFFRNQMIKEKGVLLNTGHCPVGIWFFYNEDGKLTKQIDFDLEYQFGLGKLFDYLRGQKINLTEGVVTQGFHTEIYREIENGNPLYYVHWLIKADQIEILTIDGNTGKILNKDYSKYDNS